MQREKPFWEINEERINALKVATGEWDLSKNIFYLAPLKAMLIEAESKSLK